MSVDIPLEWRWTKMMNMRDLSRDDDYLSHLLVEKLGTGEVPLLVHKMDPSRRLPRTDRNVLLNIVRRLVLSKSPLQQAIKQAVDDLLLLHPVKCFLKTFTQKQINAFATHASRYLELYHPSGCIEISHTSRYSHRTGKSELCILATRNLTPGAVITELKGSMANLTDEEDRELKRTNLRATDNHIRRDFSVIHSRQMKKNHLFLGPARFVNHDCDHNVELFREGRYITFRVIKPISIGQEITAHYGDSYFGRKNRSCLCESCERKGRGGYDPNHEQESESSSDSNSSSESSTDSDTAVVPNPVNINERRTRRGVYATVKKPVSDLDDGDSGKRLDSGSALTSLSGTPGPSKVEADESALTALTPLSSISRASSSLSSAESSSDAPFRSIIATRGQKARQELAQTPASSKPQKVPSAKDSTSTTLRSSSRTVLRSSVSSRSRTRNESHRPTTTPNVNTSSALSKSKGKQKAGTSEFASRGRRAGRVPSSSTPQLSLPPPVPDVPRGPDGNPLPTCSTCKNILPVISVDSEVVWGLEFDSPGEKKTDQECPRCIRHHAIYGHPWPVRVARDGASIVPTPRESTPSESTRKLTHQSLPVLDRKLAAAAQAVQRRKPTEPIDTRPSKKRRASSPKPSRAQSHVLDASKDISQRAKTATGSSRRASTRVTTPFLSTPKRGRGRPRKYSLEERPPKSKGPKVQNARSVSARQQQQANGRFGTKRKNDGSWTSSSGSSTPADRSRSPHGSPDSPSQKEDGERGPDPREARRRKRAKIIAEAEAAESLEDDDHYEISVEKFQPQAAPFMGGKLFGKPTPLSFAARAWASAKIEHDDSEASENGDDNDAPMVEQLESDKPTSQQMLLKPNPFSFASRRWGTHSQLVDDMDDKNESSSIPSLSVSPTREIDSEVPYSSRTTPESMGGKNVYHQPLGHVLAPLSPLSTSSCDLPVGSPPLTSSICRKVPYPPDFNEGWGTTEGESSGDEDDHSQF